MLLSNYYFECFILNILQILNTNKESFCKLVRYARLPSFQDFQELSVLNDIWSNSKLYKILNSKLSKEGIECPLLVVDEVSRLCCAMLHDMISIATLEEVDSFTNRRRLLSEKAFNGTSSRARAEACARMWRNCSTCRLSIYIEHATTRRDDEASRIISRIIRCGRKIFQVY